MCGVVGVYSPKVSINIEDTVSKMLGALSHRGPDGSGVWRDKSGSCVLGHNRLAILGLNSNGSQPMLSEDGRYSISFNGEIYNYLEISEELGHQNFDISTASDTRVLIEAVSAWGIQRTLEKCIGMFAGVVWDSKERRLSIFRDRFGKKPLFYVQKGSEFYFASEIKAFRKIKGLQLNVNREAIWHFLSLGYVPSPMTVFQEVKKVPPACVMECGAGLDGLSSEFYWSRSQKVSENIQWYEVVEETERLLLNATKLRLRTDVEFALLLSGGIDSGLIAALAATNSSSRLKTISASFPGFPVDEGPAAKMVAERYGTDHHTVVLDRPNKNSIREAVSAFDEPQGDPSIIPSYFLSKFSSSMVKVLINGEGSDESFAGYRRHRAVYVKEKLKRSLPNFLTSLLQEMPGHLPAPVKQRGRYEFFYRFLEGLSDDTFSTFLTWGSNGFTEEEKQKIMPFNDFINTPLFLSSNFEYDSVQSETYRFMDLDFRSALQDGLINKIDICSMANSVEARSPFLDHTLVNWAFSLPRSALFSVNSSKPILREIAKKYLPENVVAAPKRGFEIPLVEWTEGELAEDIDHALFSKGSKLRDFLDLNALSDVLGKTSEVTRTRKAKLRWNAFALSQWSEEML